MSKIKSITIDFSTLATWRRCGKLFNYRYVKGLVGRGSSDALNFGTLIHKALETVHGSTPYRINEKNLDWLSEKNQPGDEDELLNNLSREAAKYSLWNLDPLDRRSLKHLLLLVCAYRKRWSPDPLRLTHSEQFAKALLGQTSQGIDIIYAGTLDGINAEQDFIAEFKTTSYLNNFVDRTVPNNQATGYCFLASELLGKPIRKILFNGISTTGYGRSGSSNYSVPSRWKLNTDPTGLFMRAETTRSDEQVSEWRSGVLRDVSRIVEDIQTESFHSDNAPESCQMYNTLCSMIDVCRASQTVRPALLNNAFVYEPWRGFRVEYDEPLTSKPTTSHSFEL